MKKIYCTLVLFTGVKNKSLVLFTGVKNKSTLFINHPLTVIARTPLGFPSKRISDDASQITLTFSYFFGRQGFLVTQKSVNWVRIKGHTEEAIAGQRT